MPRAETGCGIALRHSHRMMQDGVAVSPPWPGHCTPLRACGIMPTHCWAWRASDAAQLLVPRNVYWAGGFATHTHAGPPEGPARAGIRYFGMGSADG
jgi:hypothetical protein